ncbi:MAG: hypothetical protein QOD41_1725 [Cryptosporangiaceae bacterium]|nr:hypothetical protein [Cryptosporangiaceae bacterium]
MTNGVPARPSDPAGGAPAGQNSGAPLSRRPRLVVLDGLRILAALAVVCYHYVSGAERYWLADGLQTFPTLRHVTNYGWLGVDLFFLISGFVICMSSWDRGLGDFFISRVTRLYPAYWFAVLFTSGILWVWQTSLPGPTPAKVLANLTMMQTGLAERDIDGPYWTLWLELLFYLLFAVVVWRGVTYRRAVVFCVLWLITSAVAWTSGGVVAQALSPHYSMYFTAGIAIYLMHRFRPTPVLWGIVGFSWLLALYGLSPRLTSISYSIGEKVYWPVAAAVVSASFAAVIVVGLGWLNRVQWRWLTTAGTLTYPLYLLHAGIGYAVIYHLSPIVPKYVLLGGLIVSMLVFAWLVHRFVEKPVAARLKRGLSRGIADLRRGASDPPVREARHPLRVDLLNVAEPPAQRTPQP